MTDLRGLAGVLARQTKKFLWHLFGCQNTEIMMGFELKRLDIYRKIPKDLTQATTSGALVSVACVAFITLMLMTGRDCRFSGWKPEWLKTQTCSDLFYPLFLEFYAFISPDIQSELLVDNANPTDRIPVRLNISLPRYAIEKAIISHIFKNFCINIFFLNQAVPCVHFSYST